MINPTVNNSSSIASALESDPNINNNIKNEATNIDNEVNADNTNINSSNNNNDDIALLSDYDDGNATASLTIDNDNYTIPSIDVDTSTTMYSSHTVHVAATNIDDYTLQIAGPNTLSDSNSMTTIHGADGKTGSSMTDNTWGYGWGESTTSNDTLNYYSFSESGTTLPNNPAITNDSIDFTKKLVLAAKFSDTATAGTYSTRAITLSLAISPKAATAKWSNGIDSGITYMQDMTPSICSNSSVPVDSQIQLIDSRDDKVYWVGKLKDGNCWMTQNLDYDIPSIGITGEELNNTDLSTAWTTSSRYPVQATQKSTSPTGFSSQTSAGADIVVSYSDITEKYCNNDNCDLTASINEGHDHQGNYYSYAAATAGTNGGTITANASGSICPKNWQLPINGSITTDKSFSKLANNLTITEILQPPYYYVIAGIAIDDSMRDIGEQGYYRSSSSRGTSGAYFMNFYGDTIDPSNRDYERPVGMPIRCVLR